MNHYFKDVQLVYSTDNSLQKKIEDGNIEDVPKTKQEIRIKLNSHLKAGKQLTQITGFIGSEEDALELTKKLKVACGCGGNFKDNMILIQGDHREKILLFFIKNGFSKTKIIK